MKVLYLLLLMSVFTACTTTGKIESTGLKTISFGTGGGFTNEVKTYSLLPDGELWLYNSLTNDSTFIKHVKRGKVSKIYSGARTMGLDTLRYSYPGNIYSFITVVKKGSSNKIVWNNNQTGLPDGVKSFYSTLNELTNK